MEKKEFIENAIEGGYDIKRALVVNKDDEYNPISMQSSDKMFLDPKAWEAVGKVEGWNKYDEKEYFAPEYRNKMHQMIDHLVEGGTIESYIETL